MTEKIKRAFRVISGDTPGTLQSQSPEELRASTTRAVTDLLTV
jgi:hypothetical protein